MRWVTAMKEPRKKKQGHLEEGSTPAQEETADADGQADGEALAASAADFFRRRAQREIFVRPLPHDATEAEVRSAFAKKDGKAKWAGASVERVKIVRMESADGKGAAFVTLSTSEDAQRCVAERNGAQLRGEALSISFSRDRQGAKEVCMFFLEGKCTRGEWCKFAHPAKAEGTSAGRRLPVCKFFAAGHCSRGAACKFSHVIEEDAEAEPAAKVGKKDEGGAAEHELQFDAAVSLPSLFEDDDLLAVNKPAGVLSHPSPGYWDGGTVAHALVGRIPDAMLRPRTDHKEENSYIPRAIVHRLDQGTTGVMVVAKTPLAERQLASVLRATATLAGSRPVKKTYAALLLGRPEGSGRPRRIDVDAALGRDPADPRRMAVVSGGQAASSIVHVHCYSKEHGAALVTVQILTGRMHQIRVHCAHLGAPVMGDPVYGDSQADAAFRSAVGSLSLGRRPLLHAWALDLPHPRSGKEELSLRAPVPEDMRRIISKLWPDLPMDPALWPGEGEAPETSAKKGKKRKAGDAAAAEAEGKEEPAEEPVKATAAKKKTKKKKAPPPAEERDEQASASPSKPKKKLKKRREVG